MRSSFIHTVPTSPSNTTTFNKLASINGKFAELDLFSPSKITRNSSHSPRDETDIVQKQGSDPSSPLASPHWSPKNGLNNQYHRGKTLKIFQQGCDNRKLDHQSAKKQINANDLIRKDDSATIVSNLTDASKKEKKTNYKGIMYINELWGNKYERQTVRAAQLDKDLYKAQTRYLQVLKNKNSISAVKEKEMHLMGEAENFGSPRRSEQKKLTNRTSIMNINAGMALKGITEVNGDFSYANKPDYTIPYTKGLYSERSPINRLMTEEMDTQRPVIQVTEPETAATEHSYKGSEVKPVSKHMAQLSNLLGSQSSARGQMFSYRDAAKYEDEGFTSQRTTKLPELKIAINQSPIMEDFQGKLSPKTHHSSSSKSVSENKLSMLIDRCTMELEDKEMLMSTMKHMKGTIKASLYKKQARPENNKSHVIESCRSAIQMRPNLKNS